VQTVNILKTLAFLRSQKLDPSVGILSIAKHLFIT